MNKYSYNKDFFETIDTEEKAYWLGFLYADGCINKIYRNDKLKSMDIELSLCKRDENHLQKFLNSLESDIKIKHKSIKLNGKIYEASRVTVCCTKMCRDLCDKGCTPQKSLTLKFPTVDVIDDKLLKHFIRGYFDGDGCVSISKENIIIVNFVGTLNFLKGVSNFLLKNSIIYKEPSYVQKGNAFQMFIYGADIIKQFYKFLYDDATVYLDRKYEKFYSFYDTYDLYRKSKSGKQGIRLNTRTNRWCVTGSINGKQIYLGCYVDKNEAINVRKNFEIKKCRLKQ